MFRILAGGSLVAILAIAILHGEKVSGQEVGTIEFESSTERADWVDLAEEDAYRIYGHVVYLGPPSCAFGRGALGSETRSFDQTLPAHTTSFILPGPNDQRLTWAKGGMVTLEALAVDGSRIALNGSAWEADQFCTPEEEIAAELAAAGTGYVPPVSRVLTFAMAGLLLFGVASLAVAAAVRKAG